MYKIKYLKWFLLINHTKKLMNSKKFYNSIKIEQRKKERAV